MASDTMLAHQHDEDRNAAKCWIICISMNTCFLRWCALQMLGPSEKTTNKVFCILSKFVALGPIVHHDIAISNPILHCIQSWLSCVREILFFLLCFTDPLHPFTSFTPSMCQSLLWTPQPFQRISTALTHRHQRPLPLSNPFFVGSIAWQSLPRQPSKKLRKRHQETNERKRFCHFAFDLEHPEHPWSANTDCSVILHLDFRHFPTFFL